MKLILNSTALSRRMRFVALFLVVGLSVYSARAIVGWSAEYSVKPISSQPPPFDFGSIIPAHGPGETGYALRGLSAIGSVTNLNFAPSVARFDGNGHLLWSVFLAADFDQGSAELEMSTVNRDLVYAGYLTNGTARIGLLSGTNVALQEFGVAIPLADSAETAGIHLQLGPMVGLTEDMGTNVQVLVLSESGQPVFHKRYSSPFFTELTSELGGSETVQLRPLFNDTGYLMLVHRSVGITDGGFPPTVTYSNKLITTCLNTNGSIRWSHADTLFTLAQPSPIINFTIDGSILCSIRDLAFDFSTFSYAIQTHLIKLRDSGDLAWSRTFPDALLYAHHGLDLSNDWAVGSFHPGGTYPASDLLLARLDSDDGSILTQAVMDSQAVDNGSLTGVFGDRVYFAMDSYDGLNYQSQTGMIGYLDVNLPNPVVRQYKEPVQGASILLADSPLFPLVYSPVRSGSHAISVIVMDGDLEPGTDCGLFTNATISMTTNLLTNTSLTLTRSDSMLTAMDVTTEITHTNITLGVLELSSVNLCPGTDVIKPVLAIVPEGSSYNLEFQSQTNVTYDIQLSTVPDSGFSTIDSIVGTGGLIQYALGTLSSGNGFYRVAAIPD